MSPLSPQSKKPQMTAQQVGMSLAAALAAFFILYVFFTGIYSVAAHEQAVVLRFGKYLDTKPPGLHFKLPWMDQRIIVDQGERSLRLPHSFNESNDGRFQSEKDDKLILTGDLYAAVVEWNVLWRVTDAKSYIFNFNGDAGNVHRLIDAVSRSVMHRAVGDYSAEELLTGKREEITRLAHEELSERLAEYGSGISITDLQMQRVTPPDSVRASFDEVNASIQLRDQAVNEAWRERNQLIPAAEAQRDRLTREAEGYASRKLSEAHGEISALLAKYESYKLSPQATKQRLYIEMMEKVLQKAGPKVIVDGGMTGPLPLLNLTPGQSTPHAPPSNPGSQSTPNNFNSNGNRPR